MMRIEKSSYGLGRFLQFEETLMDRRQCNENSIELI